MGVFEMIHRSRIFQIVPAAYQDLLLVKYLVPYRHKPQNRKVNP